MVKAEESHCRRVLLQLQYREGGQLHVRMLVATKLYFACPGGGGGAEGDAAGSSMCRMRSPTGDGTWNSYPLPLLPFSHPYKKQPPDIHLLMRDAC